MLQHELDYNKQQLFNLKRDPREENNLVSKQSIFCRSFIFCVLFQLLNQTRRSIVAPIRAKLMELFRTKMAEADYPHQKNPTANPANYGGVLSSGWCEKKI